jgi:hypothetical protein
MFQLKLFAIKSCQFVLTATKYCLFHTFLIYCYAVKWNCQGWTSTQGGRGAVKKWMAVDRGGRGQKSGKFCGRHKWMTPKSIKYKAALTCQHHHSLKCLHSETGQATHDAAQVVRGSCGYQYR